MLSQSLGIFFTVNSKGVRSKHDFEDMAGFYVLYSILQRKLSMVRINREVIADDYAALEHYFTVDELPKDCTLSIFSPKNHAKDAMDIHVTVLAPDQHLAESAIRDFICSNCPINSKELMIDPRFRTTENHVFLRSYPKYRMFTFKVVKETQIKVINDRYLDLIVAENLATFEI